MSKKLVKFAKEVHYVNIYIRNPNAKNVKEKVYVYIIVKKQYVKNAREVKYAYIIRTVCKTCKGGSICAHNRVRSICRDCKGGGRCIHERIRAYCKECKGSVCAHNRIRSKCFDCRSQLPIDELLKRYKNACVVCGKILSTLNRVLERLCGEHSQEYNKRPEHYWREMVQEYLKFEPSLVDKTIFDDCDITKYRPDLTFILKSLIIILEFDEHSHEDYPEDCELKRLVTLKDAYPDHKLLVIRMNPDSAQKVPKELKSLSARTNYMLEVMRPYIRHASKRKELLPGITNVIYLFYGLNGSQHVTNAYLHPNSVNIIDDHFCDFRPLELIFDD